VLLSHRRFEDTRHGLKAWRTIGHRDGAGGSRGRAAEMPLSQIQFPYWPCIRANDAW